MSDPNNAEVIDREYVLNNEGVYWWVFPAIGPEVEIDELEELQSGGNPGGQELLDLFVHGTIVYSPGSGALQDLRVVRAGSGGHGHILTNIVVEPWVPLTGSVDLPVWEREDPGTFATAWGWTRESLQAALQVFKEAQRSGDIPSRSSTELKIAYSPVGPNSGSFLRTLHNIHEEIIREQHPRSGRGTSSTDAAQDRPRSSWVEDEFPSELFFFGAQPQFDLRYPPKKWAEVDLDAIELNILRREWTEENELIGEDGYAPHGLLPMGWDEPQPDPWGDTMRSIQSWGDFLSGDGEDQAEPDLAPPGALLPQEGPETGEDGAFENPLRERMRSDDARRSKRTAHEKHRSSAGAGRMSNPYENWHRSLEAWWRKTSLESSPSAHRDVRRRTRDGLRNSSPPGRSMSSFRLQT